MKSFTKDINNRLDHIHELNKTTIGIEFEFYPNMTYYKTLESLNQYLSPIKVHGFRTYHSKFKVDENNFKLEPDYSGGPNMAELITGPLRYQESRIFLTRISKWLQDNGTTDERCAIHVNVGVGKDSGLKLENINILKLLLNIDENKILKEFPDRKKNIYSKSVANIIPFRGYDFSDTPAGVIASSLFLPNTKYYGVNLSHLTEGRIEWRYLGGKDYQFKVGQILDAMDYFVMLTQDSLTGQFNSEDSLMLREYLDKNIDTYKTLAEIDDFIALYPTVELQVDKMHLYESLTAYYYKLYDKLFDLISYTENLNECIINWDTERNRMEIVNAKIRSNFELESFDFINCVIENSSINDCELYDCIIESSHVNNCNIKNSDVKDSKIDESNADATTILYDSFFMAGVIDGEMKGGVLRSGRLGKNASISTHTRILTDDNFFNIKQQDAAGKGKGKQKLLKKV